MQFFPSSSLHIVVLEACNLMHALLHGLTEVITVVPGYFWGYEKQLRFQVPKKGSESVYGF